ncbi:uncharacterized domain HDIG-containing protein [Rhizobium leguminosarum bv. trifolii WSM2297]|uniref:Uncharacterized domain HDIG-containing protein n=1 Tax=Rhizobium leguminosarum bv. trifolii WSM2297 TaxID=754762 RepID=J0L241_RHILT|nr:HD-GYP domain-containing protein [Rhizobium leguminosarum]EJC84254.1 uncharacterized domain HDIG-containing protein [Rhizobium leguminosarum bv. trifolii WSM2297]
MRKRIQVGQLRVGMYVEDLEVGGERNIRRFQPFLISSASDLERLAASHVRTVVIDVFKGADVESSVSTHRNGREAFEAHLLTIFCAKDIDRARQSIEEIGPHIRHMLSDSRIKGCFDGEVATSAVEQIMSAALDNAGALIAVSRLKEKDETTFLHSLAVSALMVTFARGLGHREEDVKLLGLGGLVHDLGKMALPDDILTNTGRLSAEEMELVRTHPQRSFEMISATGQFPPEVLDICRFHHEKYDGSGYPDGRLGKTIPYAARLASICDVYEALTTIRPYKRAFSQSEAIDIMMNSPGHFDSVLLSKFVSKMVIGGTIR